jgi:hypothetical protein
LERESADLFLQRNKDRLTVAEQLLHPLGHGQRGKAAALPPIFYRLNPVIDHQTASLGFELLARFDQLVPAAGGSRTAALLARWARAPTRAQHDCLGQSDPWE